MWIVAPVLSEVSLIFCKQTNNMEPVQSQASTPPAPTSSAGLFGTRIPASAAFIVAILLFFLPFAELRCNGSAVANNTGLGIAMGNEWKETISKNIFGGGFNSDSENNSSTDNQKRKEDPNKFAIAALGLGLIGLLVALFAPKGGGIANAIIAVLAAASLVAMLFDLKSKATSDNSIKSSELGINAGVSVSVDGTAAFYFTVILFLLAAFFSWQRGKIKT